MASNTAPTSVNSTTSRASDFDWTLNCDLLVIGGGVAGLSAVRRGMELGLDVLLIDKGHWATGARSHLRFADAATNLAQGGLAVVGLDDDPFGEIANSGSKDSVDSHVEDTLLAGAGHCDETAAREIISGGAAAVSWLIDLGAVFDLDAKHPELYSRTKEGGHSFRRIIHAGGDASGAEIERALEESVTGVRLLQNATVAQFVRDERADSSIRGAVVIDPRGFGLISAAAVVIATGGVGQIFRSTTAPESANGSGIAAALDAGAALQDMEFIQFHPTVLFDAKRFGRRPLISEAVRGEGARLVDSRGNSVTEGVDPRGDLAPRDIVSRAIATRMRELDEDHVYLDARAIDNVHQRFPTITASLAAADLDPATDLLPVAPSVHYTCGGIAVDPSGHTSIHGLFAAGECSATGLHGANRLASNSLLEGLVVGKAIAETVTTELADGVLNPRTEAQELAEHADYAPIRPQLTAEQRLRLQEAMSAGAGVARNHESLAAAQAQLAKLPSAPEVIVAAEIITAAMARPYTLGCHTWLEKPEKENDR